MNDINERVRAYSIKHIAEGGRRYLIGMILLPLVTLYVVWGHVPIVYSVSWTVAALALALFRHWLIASVRAIPMELLDGSYWGRQATLSSFASGCLWGLAAILFFVPDALGVQLYIYLAVFAMTSMTMILYAYWISAYYVFAIPSLLGVFISLVSEGSQEYYAFAILTLVYAGLVIQVARNQKRLALGSLELRFKQAELLDELKLEKESAVEANLSKSRFLAAASHDLRQPLHSIGLFSAALANRSAGAEETELIDNIDNAVASLDTLLNALLDISQLDAGVVSPELDHLDLRSALESLGAEYEPQAWAKNLSWKLNVADLVVYSDPGLLDTILRNLISNAIRYTTKGEVRVTGEYQHGKASIKIADTGIGIPASRQQAIFQEFYQIPGPSRDSADGVGLGLAIVDRLAKLLRIDVHVTSALGLGSEFTLSIPPGERALIKQKSRLETPPIHDGTGVVVLVIDNHADVRVGMKELLESWNYTAIIADSERTALRALSRAEQSPDVVLVDYQLDDGVTGTDVLAALKAQLDSPFEAVILTGDTSQQCMLDAQRSGYKVLHKPVAPSKLRAMLVNFQLKAAEV